MLLSTDVPSGGTCPDVPEGGKFGEEKAVLVSDNESDAESVVCDHDDCAPLGKFELAPKELALKPLPSLSVPLLEMRTAIEEEKRLIDVENCVVTE